VRSCTRRLHPSVTITIHPANRTCPINDSVTFTVAASGASLSYQWQKDGSNINGATAASCTPPALTVDDTGTTATYRCIVSNAGGKDTSDGATLNVATLSDADGNIYHQVRIGTQVWTMENLKTTRYRDGTPITKDTSAATWGTFTASADSGKYCWYGNDSAANKNPYGALYNWHVVKPTNQEYIAPAGWHVPTDMEWTTLSTNLGGDSVAGGKLKEIGTTHWLSPNTGATNSSGFSAVGGSCRHRFGHFGGQGSEGYWWTATEFESVARYCYLEYGSSFLSRNYDSRWYGFSVRLVRD